MSVPGVEIIDLTSSSSPKPESITIISDDEETSAIPQKNNGSVREKKKRRTRRKKDKKVNGDKQADSSGRHSRNHSLDSSRKQDGPPSRPRSASPRRSRRRESPQSEGALFYVDENRGSVPSPPQLVHPPGDSHLINHLLLPKHVSVLDANEDGSMPVKILPQSNPSSDEEDFIDYLDYEDRKAPGLVRYFEVDDGSTHAKTTKIVCKNCQAEGDHATRDCPVLICLTCGARDEHATRSCPISKTCYTCGMKGHINKTCPNRFTAHSASRDNYDECDRCGSGVHRTSECPTLWRMYQYVADEERTEIMQTREAKRLFPFGQGGEGYISSIEYCYNCGRSGHWGDDCNMPRSSNVPLEPSAFGSHNAMSGPFYDPSKRPTSVVHSRDGEFSDGQIGLPDDWGMDAPLDVGKKGKRKDKARMEERFKMQEQDDPDDWFGNSRNIRNRGARPVEPPDRGSGGPKSADHNKMKFGLSVMSDNRRFAPPSKPRADNRPSLLARMQTGHTQKDQPSLQIRGAAGKYNGGDDISNDSNNRPQGSRRDKDDRGNRDNRHRRQHAGPRYQGGYNR